MLGLLEVTGIGIAALKLQPDLPDHLRDRIDAAARDYDRLAAELDLIDQAVLSMAEEVMSSWPADERAKIMATLGWN